VGYQCLLWLCTKRLLCFSQLAIIDGEDRKGERKKNNKARLGKEKNMVMIKGKEGDKRCKECKKHKTWS